MSAYYNEHDAKTATWLRELIREGLIADGEVDTRSIELVRPADVRGFTQCHFFAGIGGWSYALRLAGWPDDRPVWTGSCPCQPFSAAGAQAGGHDPRDLWPTWFQLLKECRPVVVFGEQVESAIAHGWLDRLCDDLEAEDYAVGACGLPAASVGAFHVRQRLWFVGHANESGLSLSDGERDGAARQRNAESKRAIDVGSLAARRIADESQPPSFWSDAEWIACRDGKTRPVEPGSFPLAHGVPARVLRLRGYGNAIVPHVAAEFIQAYCDSRTERIGV